MILHFPLAYHFISNYRDPYVATEPDYILTTVYLVFNERVFSKTTRKIFRNDRMLCRLDESVGLKSF